jgi:exosortase B
VAFDPVCPQPSEETAAPAPPDGRPAATAIGRFALWPIAAGYLAMFLPSYWDLAGTVWKTDSQGHGPLILLASFWLMWRARREVAALPTRPAPWAGGAALLFGLLGYVLGRSQGINTLEVGASLPVIVGLLLLFKGPEALRRLWFPLFFLIFMVPLPGVFVVSVTAPLKAAVSYVTETLLYWAGYPVARSGVILLIGQYRLLVADACAGLNSLFTLEALGLLYMNLASHGSALRNAVLAALIIPIAFCANVVRVLILLLVTYYAGADAGQGFVHEFAGLLLFLVGLIFIVAADGVLGRLIPDRARGAA